MKKFEKIRETIWSQKKSKQNSEKLQNKAKQKQIFGTFRQLLSGILIRHLPFGILAQERSSCVAY